MSWTVLFHPDFDREVSDLPAAVRVELLANLRLLAQVGPSLKRPHADTLNGSDFANMKELRVKSAGGVWRVAFAFDPKRQAIVLVAGDKSGMSSKRFYRELIEKADARYKRHLKAMET